MGLNALVVRMCGCCRDVCSIPGSGIRMGAWYRAGKLVAAYRLWRFSDGCALENSTARKDKKRIVTMLTDQQIVAVCADTYDERPTGWSAQWNIRQIMAFARVVDGYLVIAFRGSVDPIDWFRDVEGVPQWHPKLGMVHGGFFRGMEEAAVTIARLIRTYSLPYIITGHSLGAARALLCAGILTVEGMTDLPEALVSFGCPRPGFAALSDILRSGKYPIRIYKNRSDPIAEVPTILPYWQKPVPDTKIDAEGDPNEHSIFSDHHMGLYVAGVVKLLSN